MKTIVLLTGGGIPAIKAANLYTQTLTPHCNLIIVEEKSLTPSKIMRFLLKRFQTKGVLSVLNVLALRILKSVVWKATPVKKTYTPHYVVDSLNHPMVQQVIQDADPAWVITNACSILKQPLLDCINAPILNVHNGLTPRYRGVGNFWAFYDNNPTMVGSTLHYLDSGIDTGPPIQVALLDLHQHPCRFEDIDTLAFEYGARMVIDTILNGPPSKTTLPSGQAKWIDAYHSYPGLTDYWQARQNYKRFISSTQTVEAVWQESFEALASQTDKSIYQRMHWHDDSTVQARDALVQKLFNQYAGPHAAVLDVGCGDGRYQTLLNCQHYTGCDYSVQTMQLGQHSDLVHCAADNMPFATGQFDCSIAVGLFQHLSQAQKAADEMRRVTKPHGPVIINTLRQFTLLELMVIAAGSIFNHNQLRLVWAIFKHDYFRGLAINNQLVARRYTVQELRHLFQLKPQQKLSVYYHGVLNTVLFSREITCVLHNPPVKVPFQHSAVTTA